MKVKFLIIPTIIAMMTSSLLAADFSIIVANNSAMATAADISKETAGRIFLGKDKNFNGSGKIVIIERTDALKNTFHQAVTGMSSDDVNKYWAKLVFTGKEVQPTEKTSDAEIIAIVKNDPNAIGYINSASVTADVKAIPVK